MDTGKKNHPLWLAGGFLVLVALACHLPGLAPYVEKPTAVSQGGEASPPKPSRPTATPAPDVSHPRDCTLDSALVADVTVPDGTEIPPGESFTQTWRVRNTGTCPWKAGTRLVFVSGDRLGSPATVPVDPVAPGSGTRISVNMVAPTAPGSYKSNWQLQAPNGTGFGSVIYVQIVVPAASVPAQTPLPSLPPSPTQTPSSPPPPSSTQAPLPPSTSTATPAPTPDLRVSALSFSPNHLFTGTPFHVLAQLHNDGIQALSSVTVRVEGHPSGSSCSDMNMVNTLHETMVDLNAGQSLPVDYSVQIDDAWEHLICVKVDPDDAIAESDESNNAQGQTVIVGSLTTISLDAANSGSVRHDGGASFTQYDQAQPGDGPNDKRVKGFLSWDLSPITPGAQILSASLTWGTRCFRGGDVGDCTGNRDPFPTLGNLEVWAHYYDTLDIGDFKFTGMYPGTLLFTYTAQPTGSKDVTHAVADAFAAGHPFQIYAVFEHATDNNGIGNGLVFPEGSGPNMLEVVHIP